MIPSKDQIRASLVRRFTPTRVVWHPACALPALAVSINEISRAAEEKQFTLIQVSKACQSGFLRQ
jgi:hypothetical protein